MPDTLQAIHYYDPNLYQREREKIFSGAWWLIGPLADFGNVGDYMADTVCGWPVVVLRTEHGLRAFHNVCRHRASPLVDNGHGCIDELRCPYHGWLYSLEGNLLKAPNFYAESCSDGPKISLFALQVDVWRELVFIRISEQGPSLVEWLGSAVSLMAGYPTTQELTYFDEFTLVGNANWKTYCDNTVEGYHLNLVHPRLGASLRQGQVKIVSYDDGHTVAFHVTHAANSDGTSLRGAQGLWLYKFPGFQLVAGQNVFKAERVEATGPGSLRSRNWSWFGELSAEEKADAFDWGRRIVEEDLGVCEKVQNNLQAGIYNEGPLSPIQEVHTARLQAIIRDCLARDS